MASKRFIGTRADYEVTKPRNVTTFDWIDEAVSLETCRGQNLAATADRLVRLGKHIESIGRAERCRTKTIALAAGRTLDEHYTAVLLRHALANQPDELVTVLRSLGLDLDGIRFCMIDAVAWILQGDDPVQDKLIARVKADAEHPYVFQLDGENFRIRFGDEVGSVRCRLGGHDYRRLLQAPHKSVSCAELVGAVLNESPLVTHQDNIKQLGEYQRELREYDQELEKASEPERPQLEEERAAVEQKIRSLTGLGGRARQTDCPHRSTVKNRMKDFRIACNDARLPNFASFLAEHVSTGTNCSYDPPDDPPVWVFE